MADALGRRGLRRTTADIIPDEVYGHRRRDTDSYLHKDDRFLRLENVRIIPRDNRSVVLRRDVVERRQWGTASPRHFTQRGRRRRRGGTQDVLRRWRRRPSLGGKGGISRRRSRTSFLSGGEAAILPLHAGGGHDASSNMKGPVTAATTIAL